MTARARLRSWTAVVAVALCAASVLVGVTVTISPAPSAQAANAADWDPGNIIDDATFYDSNAMNAAQVQSFLEQRLPRCSSGYTCLRDYSQPTLSIAADRYCNGYVGASSERASTIIDRVARSCGISQKVLLTVLEKEQSLITDSSPSARQFNFALGQGCPDTAPCDSATSGLFRQVYYGARQYQIYRLNPTSFSYQAGKWNNILYHPYNNCGTQRVYIENQATAGLYIYTPYVPNAAALNNLYGTGDSCSAYGNRNFWRIFTDWFGATRAPGNPFGPFGAVDAVAPVPGGFQVSGWTADPDTADPIGVHVYVEGTGYAFVADEYRADVAAAYPALGGNHAFSVFVPATVAGANSVCVYGINVGAGGNSQLACSRVTAMAGNPYGNLEGASAVAGGIAVAGWAIDPDTRSAIDVHVYVDGVGTRLAASITRPDVGSLYPAYGADHGFSSTVAAAPGEHTVCAYAINVLLGENVQLGCRSVTVAVAVDRGQLPFGAFDAVSASGAVVTANGWAIDPDTSLPISVRIEASGKTATAVAGETRPDVGAAYPQFGSAHGFAANLTLMAGTHNVCITALNTGKGGDTPLGCKTVTIPLPDLKRAPIGVIDAVTVDGMTASVSGWALDPDSTAPVSVHIYVGSRSAAYTANKTRSDIGSAYPLQGPDHGFSERVSVPAGSSSVCVYAINTGEGGNSLLGCRTIEVADHTRPPFGNLEAVSAGQGVVNAAGWAIDPDTLAAIDVHVYVDGVGTAIKADLARPDVAAAFPGMGPDHGFSFTKAMAAGPHTVCVYPINDGPGPNTLLGCRTVTVR